MNDNKELKLIEAKDIRKGDIIVFRAVGNNIALGNRFIGFIQKMIKREGGHFDSTHIGICTGQNTVADIKVSPDFTTQWTWKNVPKISHVVGYGFEKRDFQLNQMAFIYRPTDENIANEIVNVANETGNNSLQWKFKQGFKALISNWKKAHPNEFNEISKQTSCAQFVVEVIKKAISKTNVSPELKEKYNLAIPNESLPKVVEAALHNNPHYELFHYTAGKNAYDEVKKEIQAQIALLKNSKKGIKKGEELEEAFNAATAEIESGDRENSNPLVKAKTLLENDKFAKVLERNTGFNLRRSTSFNNIMSKAREFGIFFHKPLPETKVDKAFNIVISRFRK